MVVNRNRALSVQEPPILDCNPVMLGLGHSTVPPFEPPLDCARRLSDTSVTLRDDCFCGVQIALGITTVLPLFVEDYK
jgi:hypothetical protein